MKNPLTGNISRFARTVLAMAALGGFLLFVGMPRASADDDCQRRIAQADHRVHEAAEHHGWNSPQAERARYHLHEVREHCWRRYHRWWDEDEHRWHSERDWDDHDRDRDHH